MNYFLYEFVELLTGKNFKVMLSKELFSFEDGLLEAEKRILIFDTEVNERNLILTYASIQTNLIFIK